MHPIFINGGAVAPAHNLSERLVAPTKLGSSIVFDPLSYLPLFSEPYRFGVFTSRSSFQDLSSFFLQLVSGRLICWDVHSYLRWGFPSVFPKFRR
jgi:hypothetical protein